MTVDEITELLIQATSKYGGSTVNQKTIRKIQAATQKELAPEYTVVCDESNNTPTTIQEGYLIFSMKPK